MGWVTFWAIFSQTRLVSLLQNMNERFGSLGTAILVGDCPALSVFCEIYILLHFLLLLHTNIYVHNDNEN
jgi:hypothetical protein